MSFKCTWSRRDLTRTIPWGGHRRRHPGLGQDGKCTIPDIGLALPSKKTEYYQDAHPWGCAIEQANPMGSDMLDQEVQRLRSQAGRYRTIGGLLGDSEAAAKLTELAVDLEGAIESLGSARKTICAAMERSHELWAALSLKIPARLKPGNAGRASSQGTTAADWRNLSRLWVEEAESCRDHPDKDLLAARAFEIAQLAERMAADEGHD